MCRRTQGRRQGGGLVGQPAPGGTLRRAAKWPKT